MNKKKYEVIYTPLGDSYKLNVHAIVFAKSKRRAKKEIRDRMGNYDPIIHKVTEIKMADINDQ